MKSNITFLVAFYSLWIMLVAFAFVIFTDEPMFTGTILCIGFIALVHILGKIYDKIK